MDFYVTIGQDTCRPHLHGDMPSDAPLLLPASSWATARGLQPVTLPAHVRLTAADCGGFTAARKNGYTVDDLTYRAWLRSFQPAWAAMRDFPTLPGNPWSPLGAAVGNPSGLMRYLNAGEALRFWLNFGEDPWAWVPTIQGDTVEDYRRSAAMLAPMIGQMAAEYERRGNPYFRVGIGAIKPRAMDEIRAIVDAVSAELPAVTFHLWGLALKHLRQAPAPAGVTSFDTASWSQRFGSDIDVQNAHRATLGMTQREYAYRVLLPQYRERVSRALAA